MENMTMNRVIHGAVRRDLRRLEDALGTVSPGNRTRAGDLHRAFAFLRDQLVRHHHGEDEHVFPALQRLGVDAALLGDMEEEHEIMSNALADADAALERFARSGSAEDRDEARHAVVRAREATERHLDHEERDLEPLMLPHVESAEWKTTEKKLRSQPPGVAGRCDSCSAGSSDAPTTGTSLRSGGADARGEGQSETGSATSSGISRSVRRWYPA